MKISRIGAGIAESVYNAGIHAYSAAVAAASLKSDKARKLHRGERKALSHIAEWMEQGGEDSRRIWIHAASLGEFEQGRPLIEMIRRERPELKILLTFFSPSGYEVRKNYQGADCVAYLPFDTPANARRLVEIVQPDMAVFVKYEIWRNYLKALHDRGIPAYLISAHFRPEQLFFKRRGVWYRNQLKMFSRIFVQEEDSLRLLSEIGITQAEAAGDTRFDRVTDIMRTTRRIEALEHLKAGGAPVFIAGSSWPQDEEVYLPFLRENIGKMKAVIAPHEFNPRRLEALRKSCGGKCLLLSETEANPALAADADCIIIDCFGLLSSAYRYGDIAYIGGGFGAGIHNLNEAAVYGIPVIFGPRHQKFVEARELIASGGGYSISSAEEFEQVMLRLADEKERHESGSKAGAYIKSKLGSTPRIFRALFD